MALRIAVVLDVARLRRVDGVVAAHAAVVAREPVRAPLAEDDVAGDHVLLAGLLGAQPFAGAVFGAVGAALGGVRGGTGLRVGWRCDGGAGWDGEEGQEGEGGGEGCGAVRERPEESP